MLTLLFTLPRVGKLLRASRVDAGNVVIALKSEPVVTHPGPGGRLCGGDDKKAGYPGIKKKSSLLLLAESFQNH